MKSAAYWIANFFGAGLVPRAPGTAGSLASLIIWVPMLMVATPWYFKLLAIVLLYMVGVWASNIVCRKLKSKDPSIVVIDEVVGQGIALFFALPTFTNVILGFFLFRLFDIAKPWPCRNAEEIEGGTGVMLDDVFAGVYTIFALGIINWIIAAAI